MQEIELHAKIAIVGIILVFIGMALQLTLVIEDNENLNIIIDKKDKQISELEKKCTLK